MKLNNLTPHPALAYEGIDQLDQTFHVVVMRQTYNWNEQGLMILAQEQDPLVLSDQLLDPNDKMSGVIEESDLAHYKPKCDVIIKGHAYTPDYRKHHADFKASIKLQTPLKQILLQTNQLTKYIFVKEQTKTTENGYHAGRTLIDKTLTVSSPRYLTNDNFTGSLHYKLKVEPLPKKISLHPNNSFGGYCLIEEDHPSLKNIKKDELIPEDDRTSIKINPHHGTIAYLEQDKHNPSGVGYVTNTYLNTISPKRIELPQIHHTDISINEDTVYKIAKNKLDSKDHNLLVTGFGVRAKSHPERSKLVGTIDKTFIDSGAVVPKDFDFAMWNCAYPDQQTDILQGNEWITLTNLCHASTPSVTITEDGDCQLRLYLPESLPYLKIESRNPQLITTELPMRLDTVIISPDDLKVSLVWRAIIIGDYQPKQATLAVLDRSEQERLAEQYYAKTSDIVRPYEYS